MVHKDYDELIQAHALNALDERDARALEAHLQTCADCRAELDQWQETAAWLALDATPREPSPGFRSQLLFQLNDHPVESAPPVSRSANVIEMPVRTKTAWTSSTRWGAIAAGLVIAALIVSLFVLWQRNNTAKGELDRAKAELEKANRDLEVTRQELTRQSEMASIVSAPGARLAELAGTEVAPSAHATLAYDQTGRAMVMVHSLPQPPEGKAYQLWFISGGQKIPGKVFKTNASGEGSLADHIPGEALNSAVFAITLEPQGGVPQPTGQIFLLSRG